MTTYALHGAIRSAVRSDTSPSGDCSKTHNFCFRVDGSLAFIYAVLRTFHGNARVEDRFYFGPDGKLFQKLRTVFDLKSGKKASPGELSFMDVETKICPAVSSLLKAVGR